MSITLNSQSLSFAFYNLENLFDFNHDEFTLDKDFLPDGVLGWDEDKYLQKIENLSKAISKIGTDSNALPPLFLGVCEVENDKVLEDLINSDHLKKHEYDFVHYDSPDERGVDVAFLYQKSFFELIYSDTYTLMLSDRKQDRDYTRDILLVCGKLFSEKIYIIINHWPSRASGKKGSEFKRVLAAKEVHQIINEIHQEEPNARIVIMGDFNDTPNSNSIKNFLVKNGFHNLMVELQNQGKGSVNFLGKWFLFDQIIVNDYFLKSEQFKVGRAHVFDDQLLQEKFGRHKGTPFRTYSGTKYNGGFSDHFPVYLTLDKLI